jgi:outer membrane protein assembly factor BamB
LGVGSSARRVVEATGAVVMRRLNASVLRRCVVASVYAGALVAGAARAEWPQFRGPDGSGHAAADPPLRWSETEGVAWKTPLPGLAWSSPVVWRGGIYLTTAVPDDAGHSLRLVRLDAASGSVDWSRELFRQDGQVRIHRKNSHASPTPVADGDHLIVHFGTHGTARTTLTGDVVWKCVLAYEPTHGNGGSPALAGDVVVICCDGSDAQFVVGLDRATGAERWRTPRATKPKKGFSFSTPLVIDVDGRTQAVCPGSDAVFAYDPRDGSEIWRVDYPGGYSVTPRPVYGAGLVFVSSCYDRSVLYAIDPHGRGNVTATHVRWTLDRGAPHTPSVLVVGDEVYCVADNGVATCLDARTGTPHWVQRLGGNFSASPLHAAGRIYFQDEAGEATVVQAGRAYTELARNRLGDGERTYASYALAGDDLLLRTESALYRLRR